MVSLIIILAEQNNQTAQLSSIPTTDVAILSYVAAGGHLTSATHFGSDPLSRSFVLIQQRQEHNIPAPEEIFAYIANGDYTIFAQSLQFMISETFQLQ